MAIRQENEGKQTRQGALILPRMGADGGYYFQCCDCALVHRLDFAVTPEHGLEMRVYIEPEMTDAARER
jgi:hypothetical protein